MSDQFLIQVDVRTRDALLAKLREQEPARREIGERDFSFHVNENRRHIGFVTLFWESRESLRRVMRDSSLEPLLLAWPVAEVLEVIHLTDIADMVRR